MTERSPDLRSDVADWVRKAEEDWIAVGSLDPGVIPTVICFHCQQCAEKYLKALLTLHDQVPPRTHDLGVLLSDALGEEPDLSGVSDELLVLDRYAVAFRYPGPDADEREAVAATSAAATVRDTCRRLLGLAEREST
ncbi:MAG: HEPN domain-containing protein [Armatimonadota bacterium]